MASVSRRILGFTIIELMVALAVLVVLSALALPSFLGLRQRAGLRGASDQVFSFWNQARFEAIKRNSNVKVGVVQSSGSTAFCLGAATTASTTVTTTCNCFTANACNVAHFPEIGGEGQWGNVTLASGSTLGPAGTIVVAIEAKRGLLTTAADAGSVTLAGPPGQYAYKMNINIDRLGRARLCESSSAANKLPDFADRRCSP